MSANLLKNSNVAHGFLDDLESSIYVLFWTTLMYSETMDRESVQLNLARYFGSDKDTPKTSFLEMAAIGRLDCVKFTGRPALQMLIKDLAELFNHRYTEVPTGEEMEASYRLRLLSERLDNADLWGAYKNHTYTRYMVAMEILKDHTVTIELFEKALCNLGWPERSDPSKKQYLNPQPPSDYVLKTGWNTSSCVPVFAD